MTELEGKLTPEQLGEILEKHRKWVESEGKNGEKADLFGAHLQKADLCGANLREASLLFAELQEADLGQANLQETDLFGANLQKADLCGANLQEASLLFAKLQGADLREANLQEADLVVTQGLTAPQVKIARNWKLAFYDDDSLKKLGLPPDHNERVKKKLAELEK